jgi:hypothetical protein
MNEMLIDVMILKLMSFGYRIRRSYSNSFCWYASNIEKNLLYAVIYENNQWRVNDINGVNTLERYRLEREVKACMKP